jgi:hypothetical protein
MQVRSYLAIQWIAIRYTDDQRSAKHATKRARMRGFPLLLPDGGDGEGVFHEVRCDLGQALEPTSLLHLITPSNDNELIRVGGFRLARVERTLAFIGPNPWSSKPAFVVPDGTWGRVIWNEKDGTAEQKWLVEHVVNAGWFDTPPKRTVFRGLPTVERDMRRDFLRAGYAART